ncbi:DUF2922 domain-containing protein [Rummeliibacillus pycnus]|uniref:DUF2922 domain-containing protein n=1 Tax=Rummeliibacillus pycnus TaxID=101070 RepID=UPI000C9C16BA|nr:DUF2922 domain-containing protein [Rummeliibacillus pycnus]
MSKVLQLQFKTPDGTPCSLTVDTPKEDLTSEVIYQVMNTVLDSKVFAMQGVELSEIVGARFVERTITELQV